MNLFKDKKTLFVLIVFFLVILTIAFVAVVSFSKKRHKTARADIAGYKELTTQADWNTGELFNINIVPLGDVSIDNKSSQVKIPISSCTTTGEGNANNLIDGDLSTSVTIGYNGNFVWPCTDNYHCYLDDTVKYSELRYYIVDDWAADSASCTQYKVVGNDIWHSYEDVFTVPMPGWTENFLSPTYYIEELKGENFIVGPCNDPGNSLIFVKIGEIEAYTQYYATHTSATTQIDAGTNISGWTTFQPNATIPADTSISYRFRTSPDGAAWTGWSGSHAHAASIDISGQDGDNRYFQVETTLANTDGASTPTLSDYTINYTVSDVDPCADFDHVDISPSTKTLSAGEEFDFTGTVYDVGGGSIDVGKSFLASCGSVNNSGHYTAPDSAGTCTITLTSDCGGSDTATVTVEGDGPDPDPCDCSGFHIEFYGQTFNTFTARQIQLNAVASGAVNCPEGITYSGNNVSGGTLNVPAGMGVSITVTATHACGSANATFSNKTFDCNAFGRMEVVPKKARTGAGGKIDYDIIIYKKDGSVYTPTPPAWWYVDPGSPTIKGAPLGTINQTGIYTAPSKEKIPKTVRIMTERIRAHGPCDAKAYAKAEVNRLWGPCDDVQLGFERPDGVWNPERTSYLVYTKTDEVFGEEDPNFEIVPKLTKIGKGDVSDKTKFYYEKLSPLNSRFLDNIFYPAISSGLARAQVGALYQTCYHNAMAKFVLASDNPDPDPDDPNPCGFWVTEPEESDRWKIGTRHEIEWKDPCLEDWVDNVTIELSTDDGGNWQQIVEKYPNTNKYEWAIPKEKKLVSDQARVKVTGYTQKGEEVVSDTSDKFRITSDSFWILPLPDVTPEIRTSLVTQGPIVGLMLIGLLWPYLIGALDKNRFFMDLANYFQFLGQEVQYLLHTKKRPKNWGVIYDYHDKLPLPYAKIMLFAMKTDKLKDTQITNQKGEFGFLCKLDDYYLKIEKPGYNLAMEAKEAPRKNQVEKDDGSNRIGKDKDNWRKGVSDGYYSNLYFGQTITKRQLPDWKNEKSQQAFSVSIPLGMREQSFFNSLLKVIRKISSFFYRFRIPILIAGTIIAIYLLTVQKTIPDMIIIGIYILFWLFELWKAKELRSYAQVINKKKKGIGLAMVRVFNQKGRMIQTQVTSADGKFILSCQPQKLILKVRKPGYETKQMKFDLKSIKDISSLNIKLISTG